MSFGFKSIAHAIASVAHDIVVGARALANALTGVNGIAGAVEAVTGMIDPSWVAIERAAFYLLGEAAAAANGVSGAVAANGLNLQIDAQTVAELKSLYATIVKELQNRGYALPPSATPAA